MYLRCRIFGFAGVAVAVALAGCGRAPSNTTAEEDVRAGWHYFQLEEFDRAERAFQDGLAKVGTIAASTPPTPPTPPTGAGASGSESSGAKNSGGDALRINALYGLGMVASLGHHGERAEVAKGYFEQVIALDDPKRARGEGEGVAGEMAAWAALALVRDQYLPARSDGTVDIPPLKIGYAEVIARYPGTPAAEEAFVYRAGLMVQTLVAADAQQAVDEIHAYLAARPAGSAMQGRLRTAVYNLLSEAQNTLHRYPEALAAAIASVESKEIDVSNPRQNNILEYYRIGMMAQFDVGDFATARRYYRKFLAEYPRDQRAFNVQMLLNHLEETEARLRQGLAPKELSTIATGKGPGAAESKGPAGGGR